MKRNKTYIIAEAGINHNGCMETAHKMIDTAFACGCNAIKFQTFKTESLVTSYAGKADYQENASLPGETQFDMLKKYELGLPQHKELIEHCRKIHLDFISSPFDLESIDLLLSLGIEKLKIPSGEIDNVPLLRKIAGSDKEIILSTGMATLEEVKNAVSIIERQRKNASLKLIILHCITEYPAPFEHLNLLCIQTLKKAFLYTVGFSDHSPGIEAPIAAVALGAEVVEKHFTLDKDMDGPDHKASLEPEELKRMVTSIRKIEKALGDGVKQPTPAENKIGLAVKKSIFAKKKIKRGDRLTEENITTKRPAGGISPLKWDEIIGRKANRDYEINDQIVDE
ncbi:MAG: N-acetylneuraminate synthase [Candidatus Aureabacteria bacterium]|nr:N-acetylneuraminate synthase [Candidatus Auribacterota bacterium]